MRIQSYGICLVSSKTFILCLSVITTYKLCSQCLQGDYKAFRGQLLTKNMWLLDKVLSLHNTLNHFSCLFWRKQNDTMDCCSCLDILRLLTRTYESVSVLQINIQLQNTFWQRKWNNDSERERKNTTENANGFISKMAWIHIQHLR